MQWKYSTVRKAKFVQVDWQYPSPEYSFVAVVVAAAVVLVSRKLKHQNRVEG